MSHFDDLGGWPALLTQLLERRDLPAASAREAMSTILSGGATPAQLIAFTVALRIKGETADELVRAARRGARSGPARAPERRAAGRRGRHRRHRRRPFALDQRVDDGHDRRRRGRRAGVQARGAAAPIVAMRHRRCPRSARGGHQLAPAGVVRCLEEAGIGFCSRRGSIRRSASPPRPPRSRRAARVQPARPDGEPGSRPAPG